jgi:hypothetical protein
MLIHFQILITNVKRVLIASVVDLYDCDDLDFLGTIVLVRRFSLSKYIQLLHMYYGINGIEVELCY